MRINASSGVALSCSTAAPTATARPRCIQHSAILWRKRLGKRLSAARRGEQNATVPPPEVGGFRGRGGVVRFLRPMPLSHESLSKGNCPLVTYERGAHLCRSRRRSVFQGDNGDIREVTIPQGRLRSNHEARVRRAAFDRDVCRGNVVAGCGGCRRDAHRCDGLGIELARNFRQKRPSGRICRMGLAIG